MAPLPSNNTGCLFVDYTGCGEQHTMLIRYGAAGSAAAAMTVADALLSSLDPALLLITIDQVRDRPAGSNVSLPITWTGAGSYGSGAGTHDQTADFCDFVGRSNDGRRCRISVFCFGEKVDTTNHDFRVLTSEATAIGDAVAALEAGVGAPVSIGGLAVSWHQYADIGTNAYWRNRIRS
jgi:hypothetical protein